MSLKRYRYTGKERDSETGLNYHSARYYLPWLGRWGSCDPIGLSDGFNIYQYARGNSVQRRDTSGKQAQPTVIEEESHIQVRLNGVPTILPETVHRSRTVIAESVESRVLVSSIILQHAQSERGRFRYTKDPEQIRVLGLRIEFLENLARINLGSAGIRNPRTAMEGSELDPNHDYMVLDVIRLAINYSARISGNQENRYNILHGALFGLIVPVRVIDRRITQNLVLRDADHYLTGRVAEWRHFDPLRIGQDLRNYPPNELESRIGDLAAEYYDARNYFSTNVEAEMRSSTPRSPRGGVEWPVMGSRDYRELDLGPFGVRPGIPESPRFTPYERRRLDIIEEVQEMISQHPWYRQPRNEDTMFGID